MDTIERKTPLKIQPCREEIYYEMQKSVTKTRTRKSVYPRPTNSKGRYGELIPSFVRPPFSAATNKVVNEADSRDVFLGRLKMYLL